jgi:hypothetical protein
MIMSFVLIMLVVIITLGATLGPKIKQSNEAEAASTPAPNATAVNATNATMAPVDDAEGGNSTPSTGGNSSSVPDCELAVQDFNVEDAMTLYMSTSSSVTAVELDYAASVFQKTYETMLQNGLQEFHDSDYCDPYCRNLVSVNATGYKVVDGEVSAESQERGCENLVALSVAISGTYVGCPNAAFPGLFTLSAPSTGAEEDEAGTAEARGGRQLWEVAVAKAMEGLAAPQVIESFNVKKGTTNLRATATPSSRKVTSFSSPHHRFLDEELLCPICPDDSSSLGVVAPSTEGMIEVMDPFITVLPTICELIKVETAP